MAKLTTSELQQPTTCRYCGQAASMHSVALSAEGIARTGARRADGRFVWCSDIAAERHHFYGRLSVLHTLARSLATRATRIETGTIPDAPTSLRRWAADVRREIDRTVKMLERHY
jgi:hypothetical protein